MRFDQGNSEVVEGRANNGGRKEKQEEYFYWDDSQKSIWQPGGDVCVTYVGIASVCLCAPAHGGLLYIAGEDDR